MRSKLPSSGSKRHANLVVPFLSRKDGGCYMPERLGAIQQLRIRRFMIPPADANGSVGKSQRMRVNPGFRCTSRG